MLDNVSTHKTPEVQAWLGAQAVPFHFTPTRASWMNRSKTWFGILHLALRPFGSVDSRGSANSADVTMNYRRLGRSGLKVSELSFGSWVTYGNQVDDASRARTDGSGLRRRA